MKKLVLSASVILLIIIGISLLLFNYQINMSNYKTHPWYCEKSSDCYCYSCGCYNDYVNDYIRYECEENDDGRECKEYGCLCVGTKCVSLSIPESEIDTAKEAIDFAKTNEEIKSFVERVNDLGVGYNAYYNEELGVWQVVAYAKNTKDLDYQISFYSNGTITFLGPILI